VDRTAVSSISTRPTDTSGLLLAAHIAGYSFSLQDIALAHRDDAFADGTVPLHEEG